MHTLVRQMGDTFKEKPTRNSFNAPWSNKSLETLLEWQAPWNTELGFWQEKPINWER